MIQFLYKKKDKFNAKLRKRRFKSRVYNNKIVSNASYNRTISPFPWLVGLRVRNACRVKFKTFIGTQKALMVTKNKVKVHFNKYPNFFVTKKSSKSRMGKGKGKIVGRILKVHKGETIFNIRPRNITKTWKRVRAIKGTIPGKSALINSSWGAKKFYFNHYRYRFRFYDPCKAKKKKRPFWMKVKKKFVFAYEAEGKILDHKFKMRKFIRFLKGAWPIRRRKRDPLPKFFKFFRMPLKFVIRRWGRPGFFAPRRSSPFHLVNYRKLKFKMPKSAKSRDYLSCATSCWKRYYFLREDTMFQVIKNLRLDIFEPDAQGYTGMAKYLNSIDNTRDKERLAKAQANYILKRDARGG